MLEKKYGGHCFFLIGFILLLGSVAMFLQPTSSGKLNSIPLLILSFVLMIIGFILLIIRRRPEKEKKKKDKNRQYLQTFPYFCDNCKKFTHTFLEYCENCGVKGQIRKSTDDDYKKFVKNR
ncbi:MAG: hypothetical protein JSV62_15630 [Promethearchaeota archaeon]|nr:MAG: hypothetical protein JSV62_15630 [Candidatus Lokiarchaeota archaeon]